MTNTQFLKLAILQLLDEHDANFYTVSDMINLLFLDYEENSFFDGLIVFL